MSNTEKVKNVLGAIEQGEFERAAGYFSPDCIITGPAPEPLPVQAFLAMHQAIFRAAPDWRFNVVSTREDGATVYATLRVTATHTGTLELPFPGFPPVPATGVKIRQPEEQVAVTFNSEGLASRVDLTQVPGGGITGLLAQIGAPVPSA